MLKPEEDFLTWYMILQSTTDNVEDFNKFIPDYEKLFNTIEETDDLPEPIKDYKNEFTQRITTEIIRCFQNFGCLPESQLDIILHFFRIVIKFSCYGIKSLNSSYVYLFSFVLLQDCSLFKNNYQYNFYTKLCEYAIECNFLTNGMKCLSELPDSVELLYWLYYGIRFLINFTNKTNFCELCLLTTKALLHNCEEYLRKISTNYISSLFHEMFNDALKQTQINSEIIELWLEIFSLFVKSDIFEKKICALKGIQFIISKDEFKSIVLDWFRSPENLEIMSGKDIHREFFFYYNAILSELTGADLLTDTFLMNLWKLHTVQHSTQLFQFFLIFNAIATRLYPVYMNDFVKMCLSPESETEIWVKFISQLGITLGNRNDSPEAFSMIREKLFFLSFAEENSPLVFEARNGLGLILQYYLNPEILAEFTRRIQEKCGNTLLFYHLLRHATKYPFNDRSFAYEILNNAIAFALSEKDNPSPVFPFIENICSFNQIAIPDDAIESIFGLLHTENFYPFIIYLIKGGFISCDYVEHFIVSIDPQLINEEFFEMVKEFIMKVNNYPQVLKKLPIEKEGILWHLATTESKCQNMFTELLCKLYAGNDGNELSDHFMIQTFFTKWSEMRKVSNLNMLLNLMKWFIVTIENPIDVSFYDVTRHDPSLYLNTVTVSVSSPSLASSQTHEVPESMLVSALKHRISRTAMIPMNEFRIIMNQNYLNELDTIKTIANGSKQINVSIKKLDEKTYSEFHERTCVPSALISQTAISDNLIELLKENNEDAKKLLDYLPTNVSILMKIDEIEKKQHFDYNELFQPQYPFLFTYCLEALKKKLDCNRNGELFNNFERTGGFIFLADNVDYSNPLLMKSIVPFLEKELTMELKKKLGQKLFNLIYPSLLVEKPQKKTFITNAEFLNEIASSCCQIILPEEYYNSIEIMFFSPKKYVRSYGINLLSNVKIPMNVFIDKLNENNQDILLSACVFHIDSYIPLFQRMFLENPNSISLLLIIKKALSDNLINDEETKDQIRHELIINYLTIDSKPKDKNCFTLAVECLSLLEGPELLQHLMELHNNEITLKDWKTNEWRIDGDSTAVSSTGFSGLINLGATCFLNSTLQQFFAIPPLKKSIIEYKGEDPFMIQLRNLFARMLLSKGHPVSTEELVKEWTGWDGEKMNPRVQQDACEFVQILIDKLEKGLGKEFVKSLFAGITVDNIEGISEEYHATRDQPFYTFTLPIKDLFNVDQAFDAMQNPDFLTGANQYYADKLDRKIDAKKIQKVGSLPPYFIVQLSRFTYDYNTCERLKIDSQFEFPVNLDLSPYSCVDNQYSRYALRGCIIHVGTALCGHYISYVSDRELGRWLCCNDSHVSYVSEEEVLNDAYGKYQYKNAYLLFYDREDTQISSKEDEDDGNLHFYDIAISDELRESIEKENRLNDEYSLFCSSPYFEFCQLLASSRNINFVFIALKYFFNIFPYTTHVDKTESFAEPLYAAVTNSEEFRNMLADLISNERFQTALLCCPCDKVRSEALLFIDALEPNQYSEAFLDNLFGSIEGCLDYYGTYFEYFELIERIISKSENAALYATSKNWVTRFASFITDDIPKILGTLKPTYFYSVTNISSLFRTIANLNPPENLVSYVLNPEFFKYLLCAPRHPADSSSIVDLLRSFNDFEEVKKFIAHFSIHSGIYVDPFKLLRIIYSILKKDSFDLISQSILKAKDDMYFAASLAGEAMFDMHSIKHEFHQILLENMDKWLLKYLINDNNNCSLCALYIVAFLAPSESFNELLSFPATNASSIYDEISFHYVENAESGPDEQSLQNANRILEYLIEHSHEAADKIADLQSLSPGVDYINCIIRLSKATGKDVSNFFIDFASHSLISKGPFDSQKREIVRFLCENSPQLVSMEFLIQMMDYKEFTHDLNEDENDIQYPGNNSLFNNKSEFIRALRFFEAIECLVDSLQPTPDFVETFIAEIAFAPHQHSSSSYRTISAFTTKFASIYPDILFNYIKCNLHVIALNCYSLLLAVLETIKTKMPVLPYLAKAATSKKQFFTLDELILKSFQLNEEEEESENENDNDFYNEEEANFSNEFNNRNNSEPSNEKLSPGDNGEVNNNSNSSETDSSETESEEDEESEEKGQKQISTDGAYLQYNPSMTFNQPSIGQINFNDMKVVTIVSLLNSPQVGPEARRVIWEFVLSKKPSYFAFKEKYNWRGDWPELTAYLLSIAHTIIPQDPSFIHHENPIYRGFIDDLIECAKNSADSFALAEDFLLKYAFEMVMRRGFSDYLLKLDIGSNVDAFAKYLNALFKFIKSSLTDVCEEKDIDKRALKNYQDAISPLIVSVERRVRFLVNVLKDVRDGAIGKNDLIPLFSPLELLCRFKFVIKDTELVDDLKNLQNICNNDDVVKRVLAASIEIRKLNDLISNVI